ncbi:MAG: hypothetical protein Q9222_003458 [Ikaeria aurantiellina]
MDQMRELSQRQTAFTGPQLSSMSSVKLDAFHLATSPMPTSTWLPANITKQTFNPLIDEVPDDMRGLYDIVRVANLASLVRNNDPGKIIHNVVQMLKPGGWIQWNELDSAHRRVISSNPTVPSTHLSALLRYVDECENVMVGPRGWINSLGDIFSRYGLEQSRHDRFGMPDAYKVFENEYALLGMEELSRDLDARGSEEGQKVREMLGMAVEECGRNGQVVGMEMVVAIGRKGGGS